MFAGFVFPYVERIVSTPDYVTVTSLRRISARYISRWAAIEILSLGVPFDPSISRPLSLEILSLLKLLPWRDRKFDECALSGGPQQAAVFVLFL